MTYFENVTNESLCEKYKEMCKAKLDMKELIEFKRLELELERRGIDLNDEADFDFLEVEGVDDDAD